MENTVPLGLSPLPSNSHLKDYYPLVGDPYKIYKPLQAIICHCYWEGGTTQSTTIIVPQKYAQCTTRWWFQPSWKILVKFDPLSKEWE